MSATEHEQPDETVADDAEEVYRLADEEEAAIKQEHAAGDGPSPADEPDAEQPQSERDLDKLRDKLDREATRHANRVSEIMGEDAQLLVACELCEPGMPGFHWPADVQAPRSELHARLLDVLLAPDEPAYRSAPNARTCATCDGYGQVLSGSKMPSHRLISCAACEGSGFVGPDAVAGNGAALAQAKPVPVAAGGGPLVVEDADPWGSPRLMADGQENPNYGKMPQYKNPSLP